MVDETYSLQNIGRRLPEKLIQYLEAQYHIWDEFLVRERQHLLATAGTIHRPPFIESTPAYHTLENYDSIDVPDVVRMVLRSAAGDPQTGIPPTPYLHQAKALEAFFSQEPRELVVSTGTGSGKTETFLMPIMGSIALERATRSASFAIPGVRALLLYPMNALVNDQVARLRRILGSQTVAPLLTHPDGFRTAFGMYTSRTPYPGPFDVRRSRSVVRKWIDDYFVRYAPLRERLLREGKWPAMDLVAFRNAFQRSADDAELLTRDEMQDRPPDLLVTNYSMLEYMMLRPVDASIFRHTRRWLESDSRNQFIVVLDEAHLYQGAQGTEVALLLRRLISRLRIPRDRARFILTSASLAGGPDADQRIRAFANDLTGRDRAHQSFEVITGNLDKPDDGRNATTAEADACASVPISALHAVGSDLAAAGAAVTTLVTALGLSLRGATDTESKLRDSTYSALKDSPLVAELIRTIMGKPVAIQDLAQHLFPDASRPIEALDGLLSVCAFARRSKDARVFMPSRAHLLFRGIEGVFACVNPNCTARHDVTGPTILGKLYKRSTLRCSCQSKVFELLTHRDCGAAYLRGYFKPADDSFLWHEPSTGMSGVDDALTEIHLLVEHERDQIGTADRVWLHKRTGQLFRNLPTRPEECLELRRPTTAPVLIRSRNVVTFDRQCPVCLKRWRDADRPKIMDLATKGEDPFAYLIAAQVELQPKDAAVSAARPNGGRKSLLFSDGRQKAARLARDVPRVIEQDAFRQTLLLAAHALPEARLSDLKLYVAFIASLTQKHLRFFDGTEAAALRTDCATFARAPYRGDLRTALDDPWTPRAPMSYRVQLMRNLGSRYYSMFALGLAHVEPRATFFHTLMNDLSTAGLPEDDVRSLSIIWIQEFLEDFSLYSVNAVGLRPRNLAAGYRITVAGTRHGFSPDQRRFLAPEINVALVEQTFRTHLAEPTNQPDLYVLSEDRLRLVPSLNDVWHRCPSCTYLSPVTWRGRCASCGRAGVIPTDPDRDVYMRARKAFWRDPVVRILNNTAEPMTLDVQEHTAQLNYRDLGDLEATTESFERRFRDILLDGEQAIDVLSCTTTMEVGIDIGSLIAVGLRNMPPSRHNYQQRAGRAGRRGSAVATVVTYAQNNPHDAYLFDNPAELIAGRAHLTGLDVENQTLVSRHVFAELIQEYFEEEVIRGNSGNVFATLGDTQPFFSGNGPGTLPQFLQWLATGAGARAALERIGAWIPSGVNLSPQECSNRLRDRLTELSAPAMAPLPTGEEQFIEFLFARGVLPAYAFPRDLVALQIERQANRQQVEIIERPQQGANIALSEYAPGRLVVVNKLTYRIGSVTANTPPETINRAQPLFARPAEYLQCPNCLYTTATTNGSAGDNCPVCAVDQIQHIFAIQPQVVWPDGRQELDELDDDQVFSDTTVAQLPVPSSDRAFGSELAFGARSTLKHGRQVPLVILNRGELAQTGPTGFQVCQLCGLALTGTQPFPGRHERNYLIPYRGGPRPPAQCNGTPRTVYLGYEFNTDVLLLRTSLSPPFANNLNNRITWRSLTDALTSLAHGIALAAADDLGIDPRELQSGFRLLRAANGSSMGDVFLYDTLAGGAGYSRLVGEDFARIFERTINRLESCTCQSSCSDCLRTYANRMSHASLDRHLALQLGRYIESGSAPALYSPREQQDRGIALRDMLGQSGWTVENSDPFAFAIRKAARAATIGVIPALLDPTALPAQWAPVTAFSTQEIDKDLPSCLLRVPT
jgi:ATP-dependent helicase YprA (DUF1998 family)